MPQADDRVVRWVNSIILRDQKPTVLEDAEPKSPLGIARGVGTIEEVLATSGLAFDFTELNRRTTQLQIFSTDGTVKITFNRIDEMTLQDGLGVVGKIIFNHPS